MLVWSETVAVAPNTTYDFSASISSWFASAPGQLDVLFNGKSIGIINAPSTTAVWVPFSTYWNSGSATSAVIELRNLRTADVGNDFALDDIALNGPGPITVPEPTGLALFGLGIAGLAGWRVRRQHAPR
jgi:hypothetical protein